MARDLGDRIRELREQTGYSAAQLGRVVGISQSKVSRIENGKQMPLYTLLMELAAALGTNTNDLLEAAGVIDPDRATEGIDPRVLIELRKISVAKQRKVAELLATT